MTTLPVLYLAYLVRAGGESGKVHSDVRRRWDNGDPEARTRMRHFADWAVEARQALEQVCSSYYVIS